MRRQLTAYTIQGLFEFGDTLPPGRVLAVDLNWGDSITDLNGIGRTLYVNECAKCGKQLLLPAHILGAVFCKNCNEEDVCI